MDSDSDLESISGLLESVRVRDHGLLGRIAKSQIVIVDRGYTAGNAAGIPSLVSQPPKTPNTFIYSLTPKVPLSI